MKQLLKNSWIHRLILAALTLCLLTVNITQPFNTQGDIHAARIGNYAKNYLQYGYLNTKFGQVEQPFIQNPSQYLYNTFSPPLFPITISLVYHLTWISELTTRILPIVASTITVLLIYQLGITIKGNQTGFAAALLTIFLPLFQTNAKLVIPETITIPLMLISSLIYFNWLKQKNPSFKPLITIAIISCIASLFGFSSYIIAPAIITYTYLFYPNKIRSTLILLISPMLAFNLHLFHVHLLTGIPYGYNLLTQVFSLYGFNPSLIPDQHYTWLKFIISIISSANQTVTIPAIVLLGIWWISTVHYWWVKDHLKKTQKQLLFFFIISIILPLLFAKQLFTASYFHIFAVPFIALTAAVTIINILDIFSLKPWITYLTLVCISIGIGYHGLTKLQQPQLNEYYQTIYLLTQLTNQEQDKSIALQTTSTDQNLSYIADFYSDNTITFTHFPPQIWINQQQSLKNNFDYVVTMNNLPPQKDFKAYVEQTYPSTKHGIFTLYKIQ